MSSLKSPILRGNHYHESSKLVNDASEVVEIIQDRETRNFKLGIGLIVIAILSWVIGLELVNGVLKDDIYQKPLMFACISGSFFALNLIPDVVNFRKALTEPESLNDSALDQTIPLSLREEFILGGQIAIIYLLYNVAALLALQYTSASDETVLTSTTSIFTLIIGSFLKTDTLSVKKIVCVLISFSGVLLVNFSDLKSMNSDDDNKYVPKNPGLGNTLTLLGALMYAFYLTIMKVKVGVTNRRTNERRLFGFVGVFTIIMAPFLLWLAHYLRWEEFVFPPPNNTILYVVLINGLFSYISDFTTILALLLTSPLITSLSLTSSIPITIFIDYAVLYFTETNHQNTKNLTFYIIGICSILLSVVLININSTTENELIDEAIENALTDAIKNDEALSPLLSPIIHSRPPSAYSSPLLLFKRDGLKPSKFNLEGEALVNRNHRELYTVRDDRIMVYGGDNHVYHVKHIDDSPAET